jgi:hypothetical protein
MITEGMVRCWWWSGNGCQWWNGCAEGKFLKSESANTKGGNVNASQWMPMTKSMCRKWGDDAILMKFANADEDLFDKVRNAKASERVPMTKENVPRLMWNLLPFAKCWCLGSGTTQITVSTSTTSHLVWS